MNKTRVLFLLEAFDKGGIEKVTLDIVNNLDPKKYDITVQTFWYGGHCQSQVHDHIKVIPFFFRRYVRGIIRLIEYLPPRILYKLFIRGTYDIEIAASDGGAAKVISGSTSKAKKICWVHMDVVNRGSQLKEFKNAETARHIYNKFNLIVPVSSACMDSFKTKFGSNYPFLVRRNPMPVDEITAKANKPTNLSNFTGTTFVCIGRLVEQKGFDRLIDACHQLKHENHPPFRVLVIGEGPSRPELECMIRERKLSNCVSLLGFMDNPYNVLKQSDVFLLPSRDEAFPLVVGESLIVGIPVVATDCCGVSEWLDNGKFGLIVDNSTTGIYTGMKKTLDTPELISSFRKKIPEVQNRISFTTMLSAFEEILEI